MSESAEALFGERGPHFRGPLFERQLGIPTVETLTRTRSQPTGTRLSRLPHQEPSVTFVSSRANGETSKTKRGLLSSAGHGALRWLAGPSGVVLFSLGMFVNTGLAIGIAAGGTLTGPLAVLAGVATASIVAGDKMFRFSLGKE